MKLSAYRLPSNCHKVVKRFFFPHFFNTLGNQIFGPLPDPTFYAPNSMSIDERAIFVTGTTSIRETMFLTSKKKSSNIAVWMWRYCVARIGFRKIFIDIGDGSFCFGDHNSIGMFLFVQEKFLKANACNGVDSAKNTKKYAQASGLEPEPSGRQSSVSTARLPTHYHTACFYLS